MAKEEEQIDPSVNQPPAQHGEGHTSDAEENAAHEAKVRKHEKKEKRKEREPPSHDDELNIVALMDAFTIILVFLIKSYASGPSVWTRTINKPVAGTVRVAVAGVEQTSGITIDNTTGLVTFDSPPAAGAAITAGFEFDVAVRFDTDQLAINLSHFAAGEIPSIPLVEILI